MPDRTAENAVSQRITELEIALAHQERAAEEMSDVIRAQAERLDTLERRVAVLLARLASVEATAPTEAPAASMRPPHW